MKLRGQFQTFHVGLANFAVYRGKVQEDSSSWSCCQHACKLLSLHCMAGGVLSILLTCFDFIDRVYASGMHASRMKSNAHRQCLSLVSHCCRCCQNHWFHRHHCRCWSPVSQGCHCYQSHWCRPPHRRCGTLAYRCCRCYQRCLLHITCKYQVSLRLQAPVREICAGKVAASAGSSCTEQLQTVSHHWLSITSGNTESNMPARHYQTWCYEAKCTYGTSPVWLLCGRSVHAVHTYSNKLQHLLGCMQTYDTHRCCRSRAPSCPGSGRSLDPCYLVLLFRPCRQPGCCLPWHL